MAPRSGKATQNLRHAKTGHKHLSRSRAASVWNEDSATHTVPHGASETVS